MKCLIQKVEEEEASGSKEHDVDANEIQNAVEYIEVVETEQNMAA